jgi:hypothetical protein
MSPRRTLYCHSHPAWTHVTLAPRNLSTSTVSLASLSSRNSDALPPQNGQAVETVTIIVGPWWGALCNLLMQSLR